MSKHLSHEDQQEVSQGNKMRNPSSLTLVRHVESHFNALAKLKLEWPEHHAFKAVFDAEFYSDITTKTIRPELKKLVKRGLWPSAELLAVTHPYSDRIDEYLADYNNYTMPISATGEQQGIQTGQNIHTVAPKPDVVIYSDYLRTRQTMALVLDNADPDWKENIRLQYSYHPIEEMDYGQRGLWSDKDVSYVYNPHLMLEELQDPYVFRKSGGQNARDHRDQTSRFLGHVKRRYKNENVLVFTHHLVVVATIAEARHFTREQYIHWNEHNTPKNCGVSIFRRNDTGSATGKDVLQLADEDYNIKLYN